MLKGPFKERAIGGICEYSPALLDRLKGSSRDKASVGPKGVTFQLSKKDMETRDKIFAIAEKDLTVLMKMPEKYWTIEHVRKAVELDLEAIRYIPTRWQNDPDVQRFALKMYPKLSGAIQAHNERIKPLNYESF